MYIICSHMYTFMCICVYVLIINTFQQENIFSPFYIFMYIIGSYMCTFIYICVYILIINTFQQQRTFFPLYFL